MGLHLGLGWPLRIEGPAALHRYFRLDKLPAANDLALLVFFKFLSHTQDVLQVLDRVFVFLQTFTFADHTHYLLPLHYL